MNMNNAKKIFKEILLAYFKPVKKVEFERRCRPERFSFYNKKNNHRTVVQNTSVKLL